MILRSHSQMKYLGLFLIPFLLACDESATTPEDQDHEPLARSSKRGIAYNIESNEDLQALQSGVSWWYDWDFTTDITDSAMDASEMTFIPMLWGRNTIQDLAAVRSYILNHPEVDHILVMNEPNLTDQLNYTPAEAAVEWISYELLVDELANDGREVKLVGPAMNWGTLENYSDPITWLDAFYLSYRSNTGRDPMIHALAFHWYDFGLEEQLTRLEKYELPFWVTEMANWNPFIDSYEDQAAQMEEMVAICEAREDVHRYAWFIGRGGLPDNNFTYLLEAEAGVLTSLGELYVSLPYFVDDGE